jgi:aspartyl-tRNA(Asn)/glutamyl-tRNA(Gln) amidotransferase subunit B
MYQSFIGLEIHVQLATESKVFCDCRNRFGDEPNTNVCPVCMGLPGTLPTLNAEAIEKSYAVARALNCNLTQECVFERKNYFYPDLPKNYQISQFEKPWAPTGTSISSSGENQAHPDSRMPPRGRCGKDDPCRRYEPPGL